MSEFHFQRTFHEALAETVGQFVTRKRLETAALRLAYEPGTSITEIALSSGYSSSSNFGKAFAGYFGNSPSQVRQPDSKLPTQVSKLLSRYGKSFDARALYTLPEEPDAQAARDQVEFWNERVRFETSSGLHFACLASPEAYGLEALRATWVELIARCRQLGICSAEVDAWGMALDSPDLTAPERCRYHACVPCSATTTLPAPLFQGGMKAGRYAVFRYAGPVSGVGAAYRSIYSCWFRASSVLADGFVPLDHYVTDEPRDGSVDMEMWFRIQPRAH
jgi:AraC family transcriptional regulator